MKICQTCGHENSDSGKFCEECGTKLVEAPKFCPECGKKLEGTPKFCPECGFSLLSGEKNDEDYSTEYEDNSYETDDEIVESYDTEDEDYSYSEDDSESDDYEEYVDEDEYEDDETTEEKIRKIVDKYIDTIAKGNMWYRFAGCADSKYSQVFQNVRSYIAKDVSQTEILGFIDLTIIGKGKSGLVFSTSALYEKSTGSSFKIPYHRMGRLQSNGKKITFVGTDDCGSGLLKGMDCNVDNISYNIPALKDCLEEIYAII
ncbi:MAG: zinc ribbon domain-containing protein [Treponema sp.]|nr:zinc ribbon domain-containing protein [Treponema sp.]